MKPFCIDREDFTNTILCNAWVATAVIGSGLIGAGASIYGANKASNAQQEATGKVTELANRQYNLTRSDLMPYQNLGNAAGEELKANDYFTAPIELTQDWLENTPGYKFTKTQGEKAVANSAAARGLGVSGAALKGAATFATGLADNTYKTQFDVANTNKTNAFNRLKSLVDVGENAAAMTGNSGASLAKVAGDAAIGGGNAAAAAANATGNAFNGFANNVGGYAAYKGLYGGKNDVGDMPATGAGAPGDWTSNAYAISQGINPF